MQCTKRDVFMTFVFDCGAFHLVKCRAIVKLTILSKYIKQRPTVKFERSPFHKLPAWAHYGGFICKVDMDGKAEDGGSKPTSRVRRDIPRRSLPRKLKRHWQSLAQAHAVLFLSLLFKNNKVECLRAKHSLWAEIHLASSHFALFVPSWNNRKLEWHRVQAAFYFQSLARIRFSDLLASKLQNDGV